MWKVTQTGTSDEWFRSYITAALNCRPPALPPKAQKLGAVDVTWFETEPGIVFISSTGGTPDDRLLARHFLSAQLKGHGLNVAQYSFDQDPDDQDQYRDWLDKNFQGKWVTDNQNVGVGRLDELHEDIARRSGIDPNHAMFGWLADDELEPMYEKHTETLHPHIVDQIFNNFDHRTASVKIAGWTDIMQKAKRLIQTGNVTLLRNGANNIVGNVVGDHGTYQTEIGRDDPSSRSITTWQCDCPWDQYAWQRTRQWKKYEGRPCAHVLATYWTSLSTPLDEDAHPANQQSLFNAPPGQAPPSLGTPPGAPPAPPQGQQLAIPGMDPAQAQGMGAPVQPGDPGLIPPFPMGGEPQQPVVSIPGAKPQSPLNPMQWPGGTFSKVANDDNWDFETAGHPGYKFVYNTGDGKGIMHDLNEGQRFHDIMEGELNRDWGRPYGAQQSHSGTVDHDTGLVNMYWWPGKQKSGPDLQTMDYDRYPPRLLNWIQQTVPHAKYPQSVAQVVRAQEHGERVAAVPYQNGSIVQLLQDDHGIAEGKSDAHGAGQYMSILENTKGIGEVMGMDEIPGFGPTVEVIFPLDHTGAMEPYHIRAWLSPNKLKPRPDILQPGPMIRRRR